MTISEGGVVTGGRLDVFAANPDGLLAAVSELESESRRVWSDWQEIGTGPGGPVVVAANRQGAAELFFTDADGRLGRIVEVRTEARSEWSAWQRLGPRIAGAPAVCANQGGHLEVFVIADGTLGHAWQSAHDPEQWSRWERLAEGMTLDPAAALNGDGRVELFAVREDATLCHSFQTAPDGAEGWSEWRDFGILVDGPPTVATKIDGCLEIFCADASGELGHSWQHRDKGYLEWVAWESLGVRIADAPTLARNGEGRLELFGRTPDGELGHMWLKAAHDGGGWSRWESLGVRLACPPVALADATQRLVVIAVDAVGRLGCIRQQPANFEQRWSGWQVITAAGSVRPAARVRDHGLAAPPPRGRPAVAWRRKVPVIGADVCVVGAGPAGLALSDALLARGAEVAIVESGAGKADAAANDLSHGPASGTLISERWRYLEEGRPRGVGGATAAWSPGACVRTPPSELANRDYLGLSGWPLDEAELSPHEGRAAQLIGLDDSPALTLEPGLELIPVAHPDLAQALSALFTRLSTEPRFHPVLGSSGMELAVRERCVQALRGVKLDGSSLRIEAKEFVLAAGAVENARLLLLSRMALPDLSPMTGRCFMEQPSLCVAVLSIAAAHADRAAQYANDGVLMLSDRARREEELLGACAMLRRRFERPIAGWQAFEVHLRCEQEPNPDSAVALATARDGLGYPRARLDWRLTERDWDSAVRSATALVSGLERLLDAQARMLAEPAAAWSPDATCSFHQMGTTRMAATPEEGVVDHDARVFGTDNLYVAGSSVFPVGGCFEPTFTIVSLACRLADRLAGAAAPTGA